MNYGCIVRMLYFDLDYLNLSNIVYIFISCLQFILCFKFYLRFVFLNENNKIKSIYLHDLEKLFTVFSSTLDIM